MRTATRTHILMGELYWFANMAENQVFGPYRFRGTEQERVLDDAGLLYTNPLEAWKFCDHCSDVDELSAELRGDA